MAKGVKAEIPIQFTDSSVAQAGIFFASILFYSFLPASFTQPVPIFTVGLLGVGWSGFSRTMVLANDKCKKISRNS